MLNSLNTFYPFLRSIYLSFFVTTPSGQPGAFVGFQNYVRILTSDSFKNTMVVTFKYAGIVCVGTFSVAMFFAFLCVEKVKGSRIYQTMFAIPIALASAPVAAICLYLLSINGLVNNLIGLVVHQGDGAVCFGGVCLLGQSGLQLHLPAGGLPQCAG